MTEIARVQGALDSAGERARSLQTVYVYQAPVRLWHWVNALLILGLCITGYFIGSPLPSVPGEASNSFQMGYIRFIHFACGQILIVFFLLRFYWAFVGNKYAKQLFVHADHQPHLVVGHAVRIQVVRLPGQGPEEVHRPQPAGACGDVLLHAVHGVHDVQRHGAVFRRPRHRQLAVQGCSASCSRSSRTARTCTRCIISACGRSWCSSSSTSTPRCARTS